MKRIIFALFISVQAYATPLEDHLTLLRETYVIPGMSAAYYKDGKLVEHAVSGIRKVGSNSLISKEDKFHLGSCSKSMTATLAATFIEEEKLNWKATLKELLPNIKVHPELQNVTYEMLLSHRSGILKDPADDLYYELEKLETVKGRETLAKIFLEQKPKFIVDEYSYSNIGYIIAGHILEVISGKSWETLMQERIFNPLEMKSCGFGPTSIENENDPTQPWGHVIRNYALKAVHDDNAPYYGPSANVHCSISDWVKYLQVHIDGFNQEANFLKQESFNQLHKLAPISNGNEYTYGGWYRLKREWAQGEALTHSGTNTYMYASVWMAPKTKTIFIGTANRATQSASWAVSDSISEMIKIFLKK